MTIYKYVLQHRRNTLPKSYLEAIGVNVSFLNNCDYCLEHHLAGRSRMLDDAIRSNTLRKALQSGRPEDAFEGSELAGLNYAAVVRLSPGDSTDPENWSHR